MPQRRIHLSPAKSPTAWYNVLADFPEPLDPYLHPGTREPLGPTDLAAIFPPALIEQEMSSQRWIDIPGEVLDIYHQYRPSPLHRAKRLEEALVTPAKIYYKYEGVSPAGSHKPNTAIAQAYYNKQAGIKRLATETGAGQWGSSLALACQWFGMECKVYMVKVSYHQKPYRRTMMKMWGAEVVASPSVETNAGRAILEQHPDSEGSLGIAISEAVEDAAGRSDTNYALGSVLNHVLMHQTVIGLESKTQLEEVDDYPDVVIGCCGGGSNFGGIALPFVGDKLRGEAPKDIRFVGAEPSACPTMTKGELRYDYGDVAKYTPLVMMHTLGHEFMPAGIHAGGLRYHGMSAIISRLVKDKIVEPVAFHQTSCFDAAKVFLQTEGICPAPESSHAIRAAINEALAAKAEGKEKTILFCLSGHGFLDLGAYEEYVQGNLIDFEQD
jgi:tryptophan synthase beta chain